MNIAVSFVWWYNKRSFLGPLMSHLQRTIKRSIAFSGVALHSGKSVSVEIRPASANTGILFQRIDLSNKPYIKASAETVFDTSLATRIGSPEAYVSTIEHLMAAFFGFGIDNAVIAIDNCEMPILDGSAAPFMVLLDEAGIQELKEPKKILIIKKTIEIVDKQNPSSFIRIEPSSKAMISYGIDFENAKTIGKQHVSMNYTPSSFCEEFSFARTFCLEEEINYMLSRGLAKGGSLDNAVVVSRTKGLLNRNGLRQDSEFVRHKVLDCIGDLHLLGMPILGHVIAHKAGHALHNQLARAILQEEKSRTILVPNRKEIAAQGFGELLTFPKSLLDIERCLTALSIG
jgi:UDP-3-O-[3-hydroxymyristoyl] N-acetylglucosamine deacetylase